MKDELKRRKNNAKRRHKRRVKKLVWTLVILAVAGLAAFLVNNYFTEKNTVTPVSGDEVQFHFIDVGQGDAALIRTPEGDILIDAGDNYAEEDLKAYLDRYGVDDLAYVIFTHPDADHIGGADVVLENYEVKRVIRTNREVDSKVYRTMVSLIEAEGAEDILADVGAEFMLGEVKMTVLAPLDPNYKSTNDSSVVVRVDYGETSVLFTGDAETSSEKDMVNRYGQGADGLLDCDILKAGHHGSSSSSSKKFLQAVTPDFAIISCGDGNKYGHPHREIVLRYEDMDIAILRTDKKGSIVFTSHGGEPERLAS